MRNVRWFFVGVAIAAALVASVAYYVRLSEAQRSLDEALEQSREIDRREYGR